MNEEIKRTQNSLPEEEKEQLQKYQKKGITKVTNIEYILRGYENIEKKLKKVGARIRIEEE